MNFATLFLKCRSEVYICCMVKERPIYYVFYIVGTDHIFWTIDYSDGTYESCMKYLRFKYPSNKINTDGYDGVPVQPSILNKAVKL